MNSPKPQKWIRVTIPCSEAGAEPVSNYLFENGATGLEESDGAVTGYFSEPASAEKLNRLILPFIQSLQCMGLDVSVPRFQTLPLEDWGKKWRDSFGPIQVTEHIEIRPPWIEDTEPSGVLVIRIMPRMAFGTGSHETTQLCLELLEKNIRPGQTVLDVGTGSGILAIAAVRLGAKRATGLDVESAAIENAEENASLNGVRNRVRFHCGDIVSLPDMKADLIAANINRTGLMQILPALSRFAHAETPYILSGLLGTDAEPMERFLIRHHFQITEIRHKGEWLGLAARASR